MTTDYPVIQESSSAPLELYYLLLNNIIIILYYYMSFLSAGILSCVLKSKDL